MRNIILLFNIFLILGLANVAIAHKQHILKTGDILLAQLVPYDPRSTMQGDYMELHYGIENEMQQSHLPGVKRTGYVVINSDESGIAHFVRFYQNEPLAENEKLLKYKHTDNVLRPFSIKPNSFLYPEGMQDVLSHAKYAVFHFGSQKDYLLVGLADENGEEIPLKRVGEKK